MVYKTLSWDVTKHQLDSTASSQTWLTGRLKRREGIEMLLGRKWPENITHLLSESLFIALGTVRNR